MRDKDIVLVIGESTGLECLKNLIKNDNINIHLVISVDKKYNLIIKKICNNNNVKFITSSIFKKKKQKLIFNKKKEYILINIF